MGKSLDTDAAMMLTILLLREKMGREPQKQWNWR